MKMERVQTRRMNGFRQIGNEGKMGFFPTSKYVVDLEMRLIDFSELKGKDINLNIADLSAGEADSINYVHEYLNNIGINSNVYFNELSEERFNAAVSKYPNFNGVNTDIFRLKIGCKENRSINKKVFSIVRNNPPYIYIQKGNNQRNTRAEYEFFLENSYYDITGGIHIFELPLHQLREIPNLVSIISYRYEMFIAKFPKEEFEKFKQVAVILKKRNTPIANKEIVDSIYRDIDSDAIPFLDEIEGPVFKVKYSDFIKTPDINLFRDKEITEETLFNGLDQVLDELIIADKKEKVKKVQVECKPIIEELIGHKSQNLAAGGYNGIVQNLLVKGGVLKEIVIQNAEEDGKKITTEIEVLKPYLELTNKNGDILFKNF